jgi:MFS family permease
VPRVLGYYATRDLIPLYGVYALLFGDHGLSAGQISTLFVVWSVTSFVFEVPSGAWADTVDRRRLLMLSAAVLAAGFATWVVFPSYVGFAAGFVLWGISGALMSGTFEALLYDELAARSATSSYARLVGWSESAAMAAALVGIVVAAPLYAAGGYALVGWTSVAVAVVHGVLAWCLPRAPVAERSRESVRRYRTMLRAGVVEATRHRTVRRVLLLSSAMIGLTAYDEYFPVIAHDHGTATAQVPLLVGLVTLGQLVGTALAGRTARMAPATLGSVVAVSAVLLSLGALVGHVVGFAAIAVGYGLINNAMIVGEARLQDVIEGPARATVTSVSGVTVEVAALTLYATVGVGSVWTSVSVLVALLGVPTFAVAAAVRRWMPATDQDADGQRSDDDNVSTMRST